MGSGSTGKAAVREGFSFIGIDKEEEYVTIASKRLHVIQRSILASPSADQNG
jgi:site-specific DNA-methyltransferase (adenine-specific)